MIVLNLSHDGAAHFARRCLVLRFTDAIVIQNTSTAEAMRGLAIFVSAFLHMLPKRYHLTTKFNFAGAPFPALARMAE